MAAEWLLAGLADPDSRATAARALAERLGAEDLLILVPDQEVDAHLPGIGFAKTLPRGQAWQEFAATCAASDGLQEAELPYPDTSSTRRCRGLACGVNAILVLIGGRLRDDLLEEVRVAMPLVGALLRAERAALAGEGHASLARLHAQRAEALAASLVSAQSQLHDVAQELRGRAQQLVRSNAELERFAAVASHDLQEPLRMVAGFASMLEKRYQGKLDQDADEFIGYITEGAARMGTLITDLLEYSRLGKGLAQQTANSGAALRQALDNLKAAIAEAGAQVSAGELPVVRVSPRETTQLFQNLVSNSVKFRGDRTPVIRIEAQDHGGQWLFTVQDNGIGIPPGEHQRVFEAFQRLHSTSEYPGTGLGLAICKKIVEEHGGKISITSTPGQGSVFSFTLPGV